MKIKIREIILIITLITFSNCGSIAKFFMKNTAPFSENFEDQIKFENDWENNSKQSPASYYLKNKQLKITTRPNSTDRVKVRTKRKNFTTGIYKWRIFVPNFTLYEQVSIGAFLYHNRRDEFEFDFEIGPGKKTNRDKINLKDGEAIVYCVSQFAPSNSSHVSVKMDSYSEFKMELIDVNGFYLVKWFINNSLVKTLQTKVKSNIKFKVHNSLENLHFMGNTKTTTENYVLFDSFSYEKVQ